MEIRALRRSDQREGFTCGEPDLDRFFARYAAENQFEHHIGSTYVAVEGERVIGFATVAPGQLVADDVPRELRERLPRYPLPTLRLARLGVDVCAQHQGVGTELLRFVFALSVRLAKEYGCVGLIVDAKPEAVRFYEQLGFMRLQVVAGRSRHRPEPVVMFLPVSLIRAAIAPA